MPNSHFIQTNFTAGEISKRLRARADLEKYANGAKVLENFLPLPHGGIRRRPGTHYVAAVKTITKTVRLIPFEFNVTQAYMCEFGENYIRFYANSGQLQSGGSAVEVTTTYAEAQLAALRYAQDADLLYLVHPDHVPRQLTRTSATAFSIADAAFVGGPFLDDNIDTGKTLTASATTGTITVTASGHTPFTSDHVGSFWKIGGTVSGTQGYVKVTAFTNTTTVTATVEETLSTASATSAWAEGAWSAERGYPSEVTFYQQRLCFANSSTEPQTIWTSKVGDYTNFTAGVNDDDPITFTVASNQVNVIRWLSAQQDLMIGTAGGEFRVSGGGASPITPTNIMILPQTRYGSSTVRPIQIANMTIYVQRSGRKIRELSFSLEQDQFVSGDLTILAEQITETATFKDMAYQQEPDPVVWYVLSDGSLASMTWLPEQKVISWARHPMTATSAEVEAVGVIPDATANRDQVWLAIKRTFTNYLVQFAYTAFIVADDKVTVTGHGLSTQNDVLLIRNGGNYQSATVNGATYDLSATTTLYVYKIDNNNFKLHTTSAGASSDTTATRIVISDQGSGDFGIRDASSPATTVTRYIEYLNPDLEVDSGLTGTFSPAATSISGLSHLAGETVNVIGDSAVYQNKTVANAKVTTATGELAMASAEIGLPFTPKMETLEPELVTQGGTMRGRQKRWTKVFVRVTDTRGGFSINGDQTLSRDSSVLMGSAPTALSEEDIHVPSLGWQKIETVTVEQTQPLPITVLGVFGTMEFEDD